MRHGSEIILGKRFDIPRRIQMMKLAKEPNIISGSFHERIQCMSPPIPFVHGHIPPRKVRLVARRVLSSVQRRP